MTLEMDMAGNLLPILIPGRDRTKGGQFVTPFVGLSHFCEKSSTTGEETREKTREETREETGEETGEETLPFYLMPNNLSRRLISRSPSMLLAFANSNAFLYMSSRYSRENVGDGVGELEPWEKFPAREMLPCAMTS